MAKTKNFAGKAYKSYVSQATFKKLSNFRGMRDINKKNHNM